MNKNICLTIIVSLFFLILSLLIFKQQPKKEYYYCTYPFCKETLIKDYLQYQKETNLPIKKAIIMVNIGLNRPFYTNVKEAVNKDTLKVLVNKYNYLPKDYVPSNLVNIKKYTKSNIKMNDIAYKNFINMAQDIEKEDMHIRIVSAYRSYNYQENLYNNYLKHDPQDKVDSYSARPGFSEHQTGLAIDIDNNIINYNKFHITKEFNWMINNSYKYGFILRYPLNKENITGYKYEPWHYRYVGVDTAKYIHDNNLTYEEYYYEFIDK